MFSLLFYYYLLIVYHYLFPLSPSQLPEFLSTSREMLATLAAYLEKVREDEQRSEHPRTHLLDSTRRLQETGVYNILCSMDLALQGQPFRTLPNPTVICPDTPRSQAEVDDRNYLILHALEQYLSAVERRLRPKPKNNNIFRK